MSGGLPGMKKVLVEVVQVFEADAARHSGDVVNVGLGHHRLHGRNGVLFGKLELGVPVPDALECRRTCQRRGA
jgi:hypothetical protein